MNSSELAKKVAANLKGSAAKAKKFEDLVAVSISLISEADENIYVAVRDGKILVEPYRYDDNNCEVEASAEIIDKMFSGAISFDKALSEGSVQVKRGDPAKLKALECLVPSGKAGAAKKTDAKKAAKAPAKKAAAKKDAPKAAAKAEAPKAVAKAEAPKAPAKAEAPKAPAKTETPKAPAKTEAPKAPATLKADAKKPGKK